MNTLNLDDVWVFGPEDSRLDTYLYVHAPDASNVDDAREVLQEELDDRYSIYPPRDASKREYVGRLSEVDIIIEENPKKTVWSEYDFWNHEK